MDEVLEKALIFEGADDVLKKGVVENKKFFEKDDIV